MDKVEALANINVAATSLEGDREYLSPETQLREHLMLALRTTQGIAAAKLLAMSSANITTVIEKQLMNGDLLSHHVDGEERFFVPQDKWFFLDSLVLDYF